MRRQRLLELYYFATPVFIIADVALNAPVRVSFLPSPVQRWGYYLLCLVCGFACHRWPHAARPIAFSESCVNLLLLALSVLLPIWTLADVVETGGAMAVPMTPVKLMNVMISGAALLFTFYRTQPGAQSMSRTRRRAPEP